MAYKYIRVAAHRLSYIDANGNPYESYKLWTVLAGTSTQATTYKDKDGSTANDYPIVLDSRGQCVIFTRQTIDLILCSPTSTGPTDGVIQTDPYFEVPANVNDRADAVAVTINNNYIANTTPLYTAPQVPNGFSLALIPDVDNQDTLVIPVGATSPTVFAGTGINDGTYDGPYTGSSPGAIYQSQIDGVEFHGTGLSDVTWGGTPVLGSVYTAKISSAAVPDQFQWRKDGGAWSAGINITGAAQALTDGVTITFAATTGHTLNDFWNNINTFKWRVDGGAWTEGVAITAAAQTLNNGVTITFAQKLGHTLADLWSLEVQTPARLNFCSLGNWIIYKNVNGELKAIDGGDMQAGIPAHLDAAPSLSCWILINPGLPVFSSLKPFRERIDLVGAYTITDDDIGKEISCSGTFALTFPACATIPNHWWWIKNVGSGVITLTADAGEVIKYGPSTGGYNTMPLGPGEMVMAVTNGVDIHVNYPAGGFVKKTVVTSGVSFTTQPNTRTIFIQLMAGGGGGGGSFGANVGGGGGSAGYAEKTFPVAPSTAYVIAIGAGGAGGNGGNPGGTGGNTNFTVGATTVTARGGGGGAAGNGTPGAGGNGGAISTNGDLNCGGARGVGGGFTAGAYTQWGSAPTGGFGGGGSGGNPNGTAGLQGVIIVTEYS